MDFMLVPNGWLLNHRLDSYLLCALLKDSCL